MIYEELLNKYRDTISLLQYRDNTATYSGSFEPEENGKTSFVLTVFKNALNNDEWNGKTIFKKKFKPMYSESEALKYFIMVSQNRVY